jgi:hypothetical protein
MTLVVQHRLLTDERVNCSSFMTAVSTQDFLSLVEAAYKMRGGLAHQRDALKTTTAKRIRTRMIDDIGKGAILPPIVIGVVADAQFIASLAALNDEEVVTKISADFTESISIIDGMQRTTALREAVEKWPDFVGPKPTRVEFWISDTTESLIYRMLVLNTGQVPWNLSRQLQVVYAPLIKEMTKRVKFERLLDTNVPERRTKAGEYAPDKLVELYIAFGLRKTDIDTQETLADEFSRLDMTEALSEHQYRDFFYPALQMMVDLDLAFSRYDAEIEAVAAMTPIGGEGENSDPKQMKKGRSIFDSQPARVGFVVAVATAILGRVGMERDSDSAANKTKLADLQVKLEKLVGTLAKKSGADLATFLKLDVLSEKLYGQKRAAVGRYERAFYDAAFKVLLDEGFQVPSMEPCWRV